MFVLSCFLAAIVLIRIRTIDRHSKERGHLLEQLESLRR